MLAADALLRPVRADRQQSQQGIQIKTRQTSRMATHAQVLFGQHRLRGENGNERRCRNQQHQRSGRRFQPHDAGRGGAQFERYAQQLPGVLGQVAEAARRVAALGHVGSQPALKIPVS